MSTKHLRFLQRRFSIFHYYGLSRMYITLLDWTNPYAHLIFGGDTHRDDLQALIKKREENIATLFTQVVSSVNFLHRKNIFHHDLKLENVMINSTGYCQNNE